MNKFIFTEDDSIDDKLDDLWNKSSINSWIGFLMSLDDNIIDADYSQQTTTLTFKQPEHITFFVLKYS
jgi:hypothetical protein